MDLTTATVDENSGDTAEPSEPEDHKGIKFRDWGFKIDRLFEVAYRFYKRNANKAFHPSFDERNRLNALILQARYGNYGNDKAPDVGLLDLVGKSRQHEWSSLKGFSKMEAMSKFICTLDEICPLFKAHAEAVKLSTDPNNHAETMENSMETSDSMRMREVQSESAEQLNFIKKSLLRQTYGQFKSYAEKQYPNEISKQRHLIDSLQEQYYQQYIAQMQPDLYKSTNGNSSQSTPESNLEDSASTSVDHLVQEQPNQDLPVDNPPPIEETNDSNDSSCSSISSENSVRGNSLYNTLEPASIRTKKGVKEFKESLVGDPHAGEYLLKQGKLVTIQVPTYHNGKYIYWEFVTEDYDIGFGLDFAYEDHLESLDLKIFEQSDDDEDDLIESEEKDATNITNADEKSQEKPPRIENTIAIVPTYRRNSHEEVFTGRHRYPGHGYYLLRFDNTYSVLRSKSLFFRICYFI